MNGFVRTLERLGLHRRFAVDVLSVTCRVRRTGLLHIPVAAEPELRVALAGLGLRVFARRNLMCSDDPNSREAVLKDCSEGEKANYAEVWYACGEGDLPSPQALFSNPGRHLGYPACCVAEWERLQSQRDLYRRYLFDTRAGLWEVNRLSAVFHGGLVFPDFYPCSLECEAARAFVAPILEAAREVLDQTWVEQTLRWMRAPVIIHGNVIYAFPTWSLAGGDLVLHTSEAIQMPLCALGRFDRQDEEPTFLVPFRHLAGTRRVVLVGADGIGTEFIPMVH